MTNTVDLDETVEEAEGTLPAPAPGPARAAVLAELQSRLFGAARSSVGRYELRGVLGHGGFGVVYRAHDPELDRTVALKLLRGGDQPAGLLSEAQALARVNHPNVVSVYDVGRCQLEKSFPDRTGWAVFLVMELVDGCTLSTWLEERELSTNEVIELFIASGRGLQAVHGHGIVHRDYKPANILVGPDGVPRVADFGLAVVDASALHNSVDQSYDPERTMAGAIIAGTPAFMAPEIHDGIPGDQLSDQYSFGVVLREAILKQAAFKRASLQSLRVSKQSVPDWPSSPRISRRITRIVDRAMAPKPADRWPSMACLLDALEDGIRPRRTGARMIVAGTLLGAGLSAAVIARPGASCQGSNGSIHDTWNSDVAKAAKVALVDTQSPLATLLWPRLEHKIDRYREAWLAQWQNVCESAGGAQVMTNAFPERTECLERGRDHVELFLEQVVAAELDEIPSIDRALGELPDPGRCAGADRVSQSLPRAAERRLRAIRLAWEFGDFAEAKQQLLLFEESPEASHDVWRAHSELESGLLASMQGQHQSARTHLSEALTLSLRTKQWQAVKEAAIELLRIRGAVQMDNVDGYVALLGGIITHEDRWYAGFQLALGDVALSRGQYEAARDHLSLALAGFDAADQFFEAAQARQALATLETEQGRFKEAEVLSRATIAAFENRLGSDHPDTADARVGLAVLLRQAGRWDEAEAEVRTAIRDHKASLGTKHPKLASPYHVLGNIYLDRRQFKDARAWLEQAFAMAKLPEAGDPDLEATILMSLGSFRFGMGDYEEMLKAYRRALERMVLVHGPDNPRIDAAHHNLAAGLYMMKRYDEAANHAQEALRLSRLRGPQYDGVLHALRQLAHVRAEQDRNHEAFQAYSEAAALEETLHGEGSVFRGELLIEIAATLRSLGKADRCREAVLEGWDVLTRSDADAYTIATSALLAARVLGTGPSKDDKTRALEFAIAGQKVAKAEGLDDVVKDLDDWIATQRR